MAERRFEDEHQRAFAEVSGDHNPVHLDPLVGRRTSAGRPIVHGIHTMLWALETFAAEAPRPVPGCIRADFTAFLPVGTDVSLDFQDVGGAHRLFARTAAARVMTMELRPAPPAPRFRPVEAQPVIAVGREPLDPAELAGVRGRLRALKAAEEVAAMFPAASRWLGVARVAALMAATRVVGMVCPGLHSFFHRIEVDLVDDHQPDMALDFVAESTDPRVGRVSLRVEGGGLRGLLTATRRHPPVAQASMAVLRPLVAPADFAGQLALVVGGSRGLGEVTAKLLALGGAEVLVTYARGEADAARVVAEIASAGGTCAALRYDATMPADGQLGALAGRVTHGYYFATGPIFSPQTALLDQDRLARFLQIYAYGFFDLCQSLRRAGVRPLSVFYPSSIFVEERPAGMIEYAMAKAAGEVLCAEIAARWTPMVVHSARLPRLPTDQTATLFAGTEDRSLATADVLLPIVRRMQLRNADSDGT